MVRERWFIYTRLLTQRLINDITLEVELPYLCTLNPIHHAASSNSGSDIGMHNEC